MTIDEIEGLARDTANGEAPTITDVLALARFVLDVLPVLRAEVERLRAAAGGDEQYRTVSVRDLLRVASAERDELRAEVERMRRHITESYRAADAAASATADACVEQHLLDLATAMDAP